MTACTRRGWVVSSTPRPHFTPGKDPVPILQEAGWAPGPVWTGGKSRPHRDSIPDRSARSQSLYRLSYPAHIIHFVTYPIKILLTVASWSPKSIFFFFLRCHYNPLWALACRTMSFHFFFPICQQLSPSSHSQHLRISFYFLFPYSSRF